MRIPTLMNDAELESAYEALRTSPMGSVEREEIAAGIREYENSHPWNEGDEGAD